MNRASFAFVGMTMFLIIWLFFFRTTNSSVCNCDQSALKPVKIPAQEHDLREKTVPHPVLGKWEMTRALTPFWIALPVEPKDSLTNAMIVERTWEPHVQKCLFRAWDVEISNLEKKSMFVIDIGSNIGFMGLLSAAYGWGHTYFIEAIPRNAASILFSIASNPGFSRKTTVHNVALGEKKGKDLCVVEPPTNPSDGILVPWSKEAVQRHSWIMENIVKGSEIKLEEVCGAKISSTTLDDLLLKDPVVREKKLAAIKIDVEGLELNILRGGREIIKTFKPCGIVTEVNPGLANPNGWSAKDMVEFFEELGYEAYSCVDGFPRDENFAGYNQKGTLKDMLWLPKTTPEHCMRKNK